MFDQDAISSKNTEFVKFCEQDNGKQSNEFDSQTLQMISPCNVT